MEKQRSEVRGQGSDDAGRGRIGPPQNRRINFEDLSPMTQGVVIDIARRQRCTKEEIVEVLNQ